QRRSPLDHGGAHRVVEHDGKRGGRVARARASGAGSRRGDRDEQHDENPEEHEQQVAHAQRATVLAFRAGEVARGWEFHLNADPSPQQMYQHGNGGGAGEEQEPGSQETHTTEVTTIVTAVVTTIVTAVVTTDVTTDVTAFITGSGKALTCRESAAQRNPEGGVGHDHLVADTHRCEHRAPLFDDFLNGG